MSMVTADYYYPDWGCLVDFFCFSGLKSCWHRRLGIEPVTLDLSSQSGAYDLSATALWEVCRGFQSALGGQGQVVKGFCITSLNSDPQLPPDIQRFI